MLYLEDYLEMIEHLPQELRDRFTEMREMDLSVQNNIDSLDKRARTLFQQCRRGELIGNLADSEFDSIRKDYYRVLEDSDEKVQLAGQMYDLVDRYLRRLDSELYKFKCELEADHNGITEILEKRSLELDSSTSNGGLNQKENRYFDTLTGISSAISSSTAARVESRYSIKPEKRRESSMVAISSLGGAPPEKRQAVATASGGISSGPAVRPTTPSIATASESYHKLTPAGSVTPRATSSVAYSLQQFGAGNAIAAAASQAIAQTQQMQQGRRTASLKASYEAIHGAGGTGTGPHDLLINRELAGATHNALQAVERETSNAFTNQQRRQHKKKLTANTSAAATLLQAHQKQQHSAALSPNLSSSSLDLLEPSVPGVLSGVGAGSLGVGSSGAGGGGGSSASSSSGSGGLGIGGASGGGAGVGGGGGGVGGVGIGIGAGIGGGSGGSAHTAHLPGGPPVGPNVVLNENGMVVEQTADGEWTYDPNEPRYCICNQVSYGDMVACDNEDCPFEWFHYPCVNITSTPKGKWYCPQCSSSMKRRASRKN